ncbi:DMT family transporter [Polycladidibacter hongkongensis]|uniref:DMT family transporter n=1 Tax=Polycladidibacter hongkongensis TaxID=1647556 RepID=UPI0008342DB0|nr:multidrug efflux SMR transporter [Pseudovibrio hongkongensis]
MAWVALLLGGLFEIGWPLGLKNGYTEAGMNWGWIAFSVVSMGLSGALLFYAQKTIPMGTAYAVWTGIGAAGTFMLGVVLFGDTLNAMRMVSVLLIITGVIGLKLA